MQELRDFGLRKGVAMNPSECYATTNFLERDPGTGIGSETTTELAAAAGEDRRTANETCPLLLAAAGREPSDAAALWSHAGQDRSVALARRVGEPTTGSDFSDARGTGRQSVAGIGRKRVSFGLWVSRERQNGTIRGPWEHLEVQIRLPVAFGGGQVYLMGRAGDR